MFHFLIAVSSEGHVPKQLSILHVLLLLLECCSSDRPTSEYVRACPTRPIAYQSHPCSEFVELLVHNFRLRHLENAKLGVRLCDRIEPMQQGRVILWIAMLRQTQVMIMRR